MKVADEHFKKVLNRQGELSTFDALQLRNVKSLYVVSFLYYMLYSVYTHYFSNNDQGLNLSYFQQGTPLLLLLASFFSIRFFHGRKMFVLYCGLIINALAEFIEVVVMYTLNCKDSFDHEYTRYNVGRLFISSEKWSFAVMDQMGICLIKDDFTDKFIITPFRFFLCMKNILFFLCYYLICWLSIMDLVKL